MFSTIRKESAWTWNTSGTGGLGLGYFAASGGELVLNSPSGEPRGFYYGAVGGGLSVGVRKVPKIGRILDPRGLSNRGGAVLAPKSFTNHGVVYVMSAFERDELTAEDFRGVCIVTELAAGVLIGYSGGAFLIDVNPLAVAAMANPLTAAIANAALNPKAMILDRGWNAGLQASAGATATVGYLWPKSGPA